MQSSKLLSRREDFFCQRRMQTESCQDRIMKTVRRLPFMILSCHDSVFLSFCQNIILSFPAGPDFGVDRSFGDSDSEE